MQHQALFIIAGFLGLACFITLYIARKWPSSWRYGLLLAGNALLIAAVYFDPWWHIEEKGSRKDMFMFILVNAILIPRIRRDERTAQEAAMGIPASAAVKAEVLPRAVMIPLVITAMFFVWSITEYQSMLRIVALGGLLTIVGVTIYTHRSKGKPTHNSLVALAWIVMVIAAVVRFGHSTWLSSLFSNH